MKSVSAGKHKTQAFRVNVCAVEGGFYIVFHALAQIMIDLSGKSLSLERKVDRQTWTDEVEMEPDLRNFLV